MDGILVVDFLRISKYNDDMMRRFKGFTMIEVALTLAVAGLIVVMVFIGVPALTATQRDAARKDHLMLLISRLKSFQANNNRGSLPSGSGRIFGDSITFGPNNGNTWADFYGGYMDGTFIDPVGEKYDLLVLDCAASDPGAHINIGDNCGNDELSELEFYTIYVVKNATCKGANVIYSANPRSVAALYKMERSDKYCANT